MLLEKLCQPAPQLARPVPVNDAHGLLVADRRLVEELLDARDRFVHGTADDVDFRERTLARLEIDADLDRGRRSPGRRRLTNRTEIAQPRAQPLALHVYLCVLALQLEHDALQTE